MSRALILVTAALLAAPLPATAQDDMKEMEKHMQEMHQNMQKMHEQMQDRMRSMHDMGGDKSAMSDADKAYAEIMRRMNENMDVKPTGNADIDFANRMIPHHQGAIDMANIVLKYGEDAEIKSLAEKIVKAQQDEIEVMKNWLEKKHAEAGSPKP